MDPKASAKSKRAHTQHGRANHPSPSAVAQRRKQSKDKKPVQAAGGGRAGGEGGEGEEESKRFRGAALPSNWDRYEEEEDDVAESRGNLSAAAAAAAAEVAPKSKGADFGYLLEQGRKQQQERDKLVARGIPVSSPEELPFGLMQGLSSILSVRGKDLLSLCGDGNFIIDDGDDASSYEVPFLSIDLKAIDAQLSKLKLSERLFVEADLFPEEQCLDELREDQISEQSEVSVASEFKHDSASPASGNVDGQAPKYTRNIYISSGRDEGTLLKTYETQILAGNTTNHHPAKELTPHDSPSSRAQGPNSDLGIYAVSNPTENAISKFEVGAAEAELDRLLDTLKRSSLASTAEHDLINNVTDQQNVTSYSSAKEVPISTSQYRSSSSNVIPSSVDDALDDLLAEASSSVKELKIEASTMKEVASYSRSHRSNSDLSSKSIDGVGSSRTDTCTAGFDDALDDLLVETSVFLKNQKQEPSASSLPSQAPGSNTMDNFDSWFDNL